MFACELLPTSSVNTLATSLGNSCVQNLLDSRQKQTDLCYPPYRIPTILFRIRCSPTLGLSSYQLGSLFDYWCVFPFSSQTSIVRTHETFCDYLVAVRSIRDTASRMLIRLLAMCQLPQQYRQIFMSSAASSKSMLYRQRFGYAIAKTHSRWGKSRPWFLFGAILFALLAFLAYAQEAEALGHEVQTPLISRITGFDSFCSWLALGVIHSCYWVIHGACSWLARLFVFAENPGGKNLHHRGS